MAWLRDADSSAVFVIETIFVMRRLPAVAAE
jgi:hypothetical protein